MLETSQPLEGRWLGSRTSELRARGEAGPALLGCVMPSCHSDSLTVFPVKAWPPPAGHERNPLPQEAHGSPMGQRC